MEFSMVEWLGNWLDLIKLVGTVLTLILAFAASLAPRSGARTVISNRILTLDVDT
jgi:hypothetical protein